MICGKQEREEDVVTAIGIALLFQYREDYLGDSRLHYVEAKNCVEAKTTSLPPCSNMLDDTEEA